MEATEDIALLTVSFKGDYDHCRRLCASIDRHMPHLTHYLIVDRVDAPLFERLITARRRLLLTEDHLPEFLQTKAFGRRIWLTPYSPPVRGWILQQLVKLEATARLRHEAVVVIDSDAVFVRPLRREDVIRDGRVRMYHAPGAAQHPRHRVWHKVASRVLGLPSCDYFGSDYITTAVTWRPSVVRALLKRIRRSTWLHWRMALSWRFRFSEYILYGVFVDHVPGPHRDEVFHETTDLCHCSWHYDIDRPEERRRFVQELSPHHAAVLIQSKLRLPEDTHIALLDAFENSVERGAA